MPLSGTFDIMSFADLLQWLAQSQGSGKLAISAGFEERFFRIDNGSLTAVGGEDPRTSDVLRLALARELVEERTVPDILREQQATGRPLAQILVEGDYVSGDALAQACRAHARDAILQVFLWENGRFSLFHESEAGFLTEPSWPLEVNPPVGLQALLMEAMRRLDDWKRITDLLPSDFVIVYADGEAPPELPAVVALAQYGAPIALGELCMRLELPRFEILEQLYLGWRKNAVAIEESPDQLVNGEESPFESLLGAARALLRERQFDEAATLLRSALRLDPFHGETRSLMRHLQNQQLEELYRLFPPYRVPSVSRDRDELESVSLTPSEKFLLSRIDGRWDVATLTVLIPLGELETLRTLRKLRHIGLITLQ